MERTYAEVVEENERIKDVLFTVMNLIKPLYKKLDMSDCANCVHENWGGQVCKECLQGSNKEVE